MLFHEKGLLADDSREVSYLIFSKIEKNVALIFACCCRDWRLKGLLILYKLLLWTLQSLYNFD